ncbi:MAG TPA: LemA family protein [Candidatus Nanoarchaeia archaeon]|nr:LemA family protein [Candidatus Nanoarchaeia archaeon]
MKTKGWIILGVIALIVLILVGTLWGSYNGLVSGDENVKQKWANVQTAYQRRIDLIPNLISTVKASADFEKKMQTDIAALRTGITDAGTPQEIDLFGQKINTAINLVYENYPAIKSTENFLSLQDELAGTENRIKVDRDNFNEAVKNYNLKVRRFPSNIIAGWFGFETKTSFQADEGAEKAVKVEF